MASRNDEAASAQDLQYENRFVCSMDVLGFKQLVNDSVSDPNSMERVKALSSLLLREKESYIEGRWNSKFKMPFVNRDAIRDKLLTEDSIPLGISLFSDSIIVSYKPKPCERFVEWYRQLNQIFHDLCMLQSTFVANGYFIRGGLSYGKLHHAGDICIGPALIESVQLESKAVFPYIAVSEAFAGKVLQDGQSCEVDDWSLGYKRPLKLADAANSFYNTYLDRSWTGSNQERKFKLDFLLATLYERPIAMRAIRSKIVEELSKPYPESIRAKYVWLRDYFNNTLYSLDGYSYLLIEQ